MQNTKSKLFSVHLLIPAGVVLFCMLIAYAVQGVFPFGTESVVHDDMGQCSVPIFYSIWDALHADGSLLYNLRTAGGIFISGEFEGGLSLFNILFFLICPRDQILESMSFLLLFKMMLASVTAMLLFRSKFPMHPLWQTVFSVLYAFNPFLLQYYSNASWLEIVMLLPLIFLGADKLFTEKKPALYIIALAYSLILQLYISYMVVLFLFLDGALYIFLLIPKAERKSACMRYGISTLLALALSAFSAMPSFFYMTSTSRYQNTKSYFSILLSTSANSVNKFGMLFILTALPLAITVILLLNFRRRFKPCLFFCISLLLFILPVFFENINLMWHMGSYVNFSMRYAFIFHLMLLCAASYTLSFLPQNLFTGKRYELIISVIVAVCLEIAAVCVMSGLYSAEGKGIIYTKNFYRVLIAFALCLAFYFLLMKFSGKRISCILVCSLVLFECIFYSARAVTTGSPRKYEYSLDFIDECDTIRETIPIDRSDMFRIKNIDASLNTNYPLVIGRASMSNFTHTIPASIKKTMLRLGYSAVYTRILDTGGTLFTDALLGYRYVLSLNKLPSEDYSFLGTAGRYMVYASRYTFPFGVVCSQKITDDSVFSTYAFDSMNNIWRSVSGSDTDLLDRPKTERTDRSDEIEYTFDIDGTKELYLVVSGMTKRKNIRILVNGGAVAVPNLGEADNTLYTTRFNNSILDAGEFTDAHVTVRVQLLNPALKPKNIQMRVAALNKSMLMEYSEKIRDSVQVSADGRTYHITANATDNNRVLFLPITYDASIRCRVNGRAQTISRALDNFVSVPLEKGNNQITLTFVPKGFMIGVWISIAALLLSALWILMQNTINDKCSHGKFGSFVLVAYYVADIGAFAALYITPILGKLYTLIAGG